MYAYGVKGLQRFDFEGAKKWYKVGLKDIRDDTEESERSEKSEKGVEETVSYQEESDEGSASEV